MSRTSIPPLERVTRRSAAETVESPLLTAAEAASYLRRSRSFTSEHRAELGGRRIGSRLMFHRDDLAAYLERCRISDEAPATPAATEPTPIRRGSALTHTTPTNPMTGLPWGVYDQATHSETRRRG